MRRVLVVSLVLTLLLVVAGLVLYSAGWLTPVSAAGTTTLSSGTNIGTAADSIAAPSTDQAGAADSVSGSGVDGENATYTQQGHDGLCDHDQSASAGY